MMTNIRTPPHTNKKKHLFGEPEKLLSKQLRLKLLIMMDGETLCFDLKRAVSPCMAFFVFTFRFSYRRNRMQ